MLERYLGHTPERLPLPSHVREDLLQFFEDRRCLQYTTARPTLSGMCPLKLSQADKALSANILQLQDTKTPAFDHTGQRPVRWQCNSLCGAHEESVCFTNAANG